MDAVSQPKIVVVPGPSPSIEDRDSLGEQVKTHVAAGHTRLIFDFSAVEFIDSSFLGFLIVMLKKAKSAGGDLRLCGLRPPVMAIFQVMRLNRIFEIHATPDEATDSYQ